MNLEIEAKFKIDNFDPIKETLLSQGPRLSLKRTHDQYFDVPEDRPHTRYLRIRFAESDGKGRLAYHEVVNDLETKEWETDVSDAKTSQELLANLGFQPGVTVIKTRETYSFNGATVVLDTVEELGTFVEIEAPDEAALNETIGLLQIDETGRVKGLGYPDLLKQARIAP